MEAYVREYCGGGGCSNNSLTTRWGTRNLSYILPLFFLIFLQLLLTQQLFKFYQLHYSSLLLLTSSSIVEVLIAKAGHVWVSWLEEFLLYMLWFNFILGLIFIFPCFKLIIIYYHAQKQRKIKIKPRIKLNHNIYLIANIATGLLLLGNRLAYAQPQLISTKERRSALPPQTRPPVKN